MDELNKVSVPEGFDCNDLRAILDALNFTEDYTLVSNAHFNVKDKIISMLSKMQIPTKEIIASHKKLIAKSEQRRAAWMKQRKQL